MEGVTGENLLRLLERRLDNVVYRLGFANTRREARQMVCHGHITVNGKRVDIPSYQVSVGEVISIRKRAAGAEQVKQFWKTIAATMIPKWLELNRRDPRRKSQSPFPP